MGKRSVIIAAVVCISLFASSAVARTYNGDLRHATKKGMLYSGDTFEAKLLWNATFFNDNYRRAYIKKTAKINQFDAIRAARYTAEQEYKQSEGWDFFIGFYTKKAYKKFSSEQDSFWKIQLITGSGQVVKPISIELIPLAPYESIMFPYLNRWSKGYRVTFPKVDLGNDIVLKLHSIVGESTLKWRLGKAQKLKTKSYDGRGRKK
jgi:hypothetical protein